VKGRHAVPDRRGFLQPAVLTLTAAVALAATGGAATLTGWATGSAPATVTVYAAEIPRMTQPRVIRHAQPRIVWTSVEIAPDVPVQRYVVTRHLGSVAQVACDVPATAGPRCTDVHAPAGYRATYTVTATYGSYWIGPDSAPSRVVATPGVAVPILVDGVTIVPGTAGVPVVVGAAPVAGTAGPSAPASNVAVAPGAGTGPDPAESSPAAVVVVPPVVKPPAPPPNEPPGADPEPVEEAGKGPEKDAGKGAEKGPPDDLELPLPALEHGRVPEAVTGR
jgi:hypothetical protein